ncbi:hypothetical protein Rumi2_04650 [[Ruminococcus] torques]|nr:hypothetical protein Rumi1_23510 [[Ruminococcus] torques]BEI77305.1 hypothetical protein Rumi2_04650 [[Ruminococcus] torques]
MKEPKAPVSKFDIYKSASAGYSDPADAFLSFYFIFYETLSRHFFDTCHRHCSRTDMAGNT